MARNEQSVLRKRHRERLMSPRWGKHPPIHVLPRHERAHMGHPAITCWCDVCLERVVPMQDGTCGFCCAPVTYEAKRAMFEQRVQRAVEKIRHQAERDAKRRREVEARLEARGPTQADRICAFLAEHGPSLTGAMRAELGLSTGTITRTLSDLVRAGTVEIADRLYTGRAPRKVYRLAEYREKAT